MLLPDERTDISTGAIERPFRRITRQEILNEKRLRNTDMLPDVLGEPSAGKIRGRHAAQLREENRRLRKELEELQRRVQQHRAAELQLEKTTADIHKGHQQEIEQYQAHLRELMDELNQKQQAYQALEQRFQNLYHSFHEAVEEEASKMVAEASQTLVLSPEHAPAILHDVVKTLEFKVKQTEDQRIAEIMALMRQVQHKARLLEEELADERRKLDAERENLRKLQNSIRENAQMRYKAISSLLRARFVVAVTLLTTALLLALPPLQLVFLSFNWPEKLALFSPIPLCMVLAFIVARFSSRIKYRSPSKPKDQKAADKAAAVTKPIPVARKG